jgi:hypothetical protein
VPLRARRALGWRQSQRLVDPALHELAFGSPRPHTRTNCSLESEVRVRFGADLTIVAHREGFLHRRPERFAVELERVRQADLAPERRAPDLIAFELEHPVQQGDAVVHLVPADGEVGGALEPQRRFCA